MKKVIDKITNKDRLIKLYGCSECDGDGYQIVSDNAHHPLCDGDCSQGMCPVEIPVQIECDECQCRGYIINRDSHVLDIIEQLCFYRITAKLIKKKGSAHKDTVEIANYRLAQALIKLIELIISEQQHLDIRKGSIFANDHNNLDKKTSTLIKFLINNDLNASIHCLTSICKHHKIDIWQSVKEILEEEK